jgi:hypothetical protein
LPRKAIDGVLAHAGLAGTGMFRHYLSSFLVVRAGDGGGTWWHDNSGPAARGAAMSKKFPKVVLRISTCETVIYDRNFCS